MSDYDGRERMETITTWSGSDLSIQSPSEVEAWRAEFGGPTSRQEVVCYGPTGQSQNVYATIFEELLLLRERVEKLEGEG